MPKELYRYAFSSEVPIEDIESSLLLAALATESVHGEAQARLDVTHYFDVERRSCVIDAGTTAGRDFNRLFVGFIRREFGDGTFEVERIDSLSSSSAA